MQFLIRWLVTTVAVAAAVWIVPGISIAQGATTWVSVALLGLVLTLLDQSVKPVLRFLSLPLTIVTLGLFSIVVNALVLQLADWLANGLFDTGIYILSFGSALGAAIIISLVSMLMENILEKNAKS
ncbi:phage holin family protein [Slackia heliotrinireducens]|uniref:phage holin family protein n=1 Tax=Slackia heliotrinireducens TaxID=84110 RepID=UPI0033154BEE